MVFVSKFFDSAGHEVDVQWLAKDLAGIGIVVSENDDNYREEFAEDEGNVTMSIPWQQYLTRTITTSFVTTQSMSVWFITA